MRSLYVLRHPHIVWANTDTGCSRVHYAHAPFHSELVMFLVVFTLHK